ncbi:MAG TPA: hypothetical protein VKG23_05255 [Thermoanaerobaculia bacterium]|nr:hypothetical protein [Thermoanaerobaculia bacterium]
MSDDVKAIQDEATIRRAVVAALEDDVKAADADALALRLIRDGKMRVDPDGVVALLPVRHPSAGFGNVSRAELLAYQPPRKPGPPARDPRTLMIDEMSDEEVVARAEREQPFYREHSRRVGEAMARISRKPADDETRTRHEELVKSAAGTQEEYEAARRARLNPGARMFADATAEEVARKWKSHRDQESRRVALSKMSDEEVVRLAEADHDFWVEHKKEANAAASRLAKAREQGGYR